MVFVFFGPVDVIGTYYLVTLNFSWLLILPASAMGFFSTGVLNLNNMRDIENDSKSYKHTIALKFGYSKAKIYHFSMIVLALLSLVAFTLTTASGILPFIYIITYPVFIKDLIVISKIKDNSKLDPYLKRLALSTLITTLLFGLGLNLT